MSYFNYQFRNEALLQQALTHKSAQSENEGLHNEKLEFLGDAVLDLVLGEFLLERFGNETEGDLSRRRASLVNEAMLASVAAEMALAEALRIGRGEEKTGGREKPRILASAYEALVGALFLDAGYDVTKKIIRDQFSSRMEQDLLPEFDYKSKIQEFYQSRNEGTPTYNVLQEEGPSHEKTFTVALMIGGKALASGVGKSKKLAEQDAARSAFLSLNSKERGPGL